MVLVESILRSSTFDGFRLFYVLLTHVNKEPLDTRGAAAISLITYARG